MTAATLPTRIPGAALRDPTDTAQALLTFAVEHNLTWPRDVTMRDDLAALFVYHRSVDELRGWCEALGLVVEEFRVGDRCIWTGHGQFGAWQLFAQAASSGGGS